MSEIGWLCLYCGAVLLVSMAGGSIPFLGKITHNRLQMYLSASAGVMLGAAFFHVMPDAMEYSGAYFGWWMALGVVGLFCIERFIAPHSHEVPGHGHHDNGHAHLHVKEVEHAKEMGAVCAHDHGHNHGDNHGSGEHRAAAPAVAGWMAVVGLTIHTFMNGVGLAGMVRADHAKLLFFPGWAIFLAIVAHKPADALAISTVLVRKGTSRAKVMLVQTGFALTIALGAFAFILTAGSIQEGLRQQLIGAALAFSAGTFLFISLSDLLPEVQFHKHDRIPLFLSLVCGVVLMGFIGILEDLGHKDIQAKAPNQQQAQPDNRDQQVKK